MKVGIIDYGMGNLGSVSRALAAIGVHPVIAARPEQLDDVDRLILPGVGSFGDGMTHLEKHGWVDAIGEWTSVGKPFLGICLGMHLLASRGTEGGERAGLGLVPGVVRRLDALGCSGRIPHVGWNDVRLTDPDGALFGGIPTGTDFYFVHSYAFEAADPADVLGEIEYGAMVPAAVGRDNVVGTQFHPEKSSKAGLRLLRNFVGDDRC